MIISRGKNVRISLNVSMSESLKVADCQLLASFILMLSLPSECIFTLAIFAYMHVLPNAVL